MRLARLGPVGAEQPVLFDGDVTFDLSGVVPDLVGDYLSKASLDQIREAAIAGLPQLDSKGLRFGSPIGRPGAVYCIGQNYAAHAAESGNPPPEFPIVFMKPSNTVVGPFDKRRHPAQRAEDRLGGRARRRDRRPRLLPRDDGRGRRGHRGLRARRRPVGAGVPAGGLRRAVDARASRRRASCRSARGW